MTAYAGAQRNGPSNNLDQTSQSSSHGVTCFPYGEADERIDSRVGRFHVLEGYRGEDMTYRRIFNSAPFVLGVPLPSRLDRLAKKLPGDYLSQLVDLYQRSTLMPLYQQFGGSHSVSNGNKKVYAAISSNAQWKQNAPETQLCLQCLAEDEETFGWPIIRRSHNIPGVAACWKHRTWLANKCSHCGCPYQPPHGFSLTPWKGCVSCNAFPIQGAGQEHGVPPEIEIEYAVFAKTLLDAAPIEVPSQKLAQLYRHRAVSMGFSRKSLVDRAMLAAAISQRFGKTVLGRVDPDFDPVSRKHSWFHIIQMQCNEAPFTRHLLVAMTLFEDAPSFIEQLRLLKAGKLDDQLERRRTEVSSDRSIKELRKAAAQERFNELVTYAVEQDLDVESLWKRRYGDMKILAKHATDSVQRLRDAITKRRKRLNSKQGTASRSCSLNKADGEWASRITEEAVRLYASAEKPFRISMNRLKAEAGIRQNIDSATCPLAYAALQSSIESVWHFYARRLIWMARLYRGDLAASNKIRRGVDYYRMTEVYRYFEPSLPAYASIDTPIDSLLTALGIARDWEGPCPGKYIRPVGRACYRENTLRLVATGPGSDHQRENNGNADL
ncbi:MAG TPA: TniQ family protein [Noviherbaspirillum sp.]|uniref:TniQ family protein n=1 Tax=Noviherbaspirillum sp. TaxID=1926288 RepID=UPI002B46673D|nr:TniQ family protein [Noviherbaspirillum sp.]HJV86064.1 TniQ family protein [Noviherbaspirillum sp.]